MKSFAKKLGKKRFGSKSSSSKNLSGSDQELSNTHPKPTTNSTEDSAVDSDKKPHQPSTTPQQKKKGQKTFRKPQDLEKISLLGEGSYGEVYLVRNKETGALHALKIMQLDNDSSAEQIMKEIDILHEADSKYVTRYDGYYLEKNCLSILMEYCSAGSLQEILMARGEPLTEVEVACCIRSVLKALESLHKSHKIHRDIKSHNILMNGEARVKLADFGVSRELMNSTALARTVVGTPLWMAPEVIEGTDYNYLADIWSVGITTIELAEGVPPLSNVPNMRALFQIPQRPPPTLSKPEKFSDEMNDFITQCLQKQPSERPNASALLKHNFLRKQAKKSKKVLTALMEEITEKYQEAGGKEAFFEELRLKNQEQDQTTTTVSSFGTDDSSGDDNFDTMIVNSNTQTYADSNSEDSEDSSSEEDDNGTMVRKTTTSTIVKKSEPKPDSPIIHAISEEQNDILHAQFKGLTREEVEEKLESLPQEQERDIQRLKDDYEKRRKAILHTLKDKKKEIHKNVVGPPTLPDRGSKPDLHKILAKFGEQGEQE